MTLVRELYGVRVVREMLPHGTSCSFDGHGIPPLVWLEMVYLPDGTRMPWCIAHFEDGCAPRAIDEPVLAAAGD